MRCFGSTLIRICFFAFRSAGLLPIVGAVSNATAAPGCSAMPVRGGGWSLRFNHDSAAACGGTGGSASVAVGTTQTLATGVTVTASVDSERNNVTIVLSGNASAW